MGVKTSYFAANFARKSATRMSIQGSLFSIVPILSGDNYKKWKEDLDVALCLMELDLALREPKPIVTATSTTEEKQKLEKWETTNRKCVTLIKRSIPENMKASVEKMDTATEYLPAIKELFEVSQSGEKAELMNQILSAKFDGNGSVREHILEISSVAQKLKDLDTNLDDDFLVSLTLKSLPEQYETLKTTYAALRVKWTMKELISICTQEEQNKKSKKKIESANVTTSKGGVGPYRNKKRFSKKGRFRPYDRSNRDRAPQRDQPQGFIRRRTPSKDEVAVFVENGVEVTVEAIGVVRILLAGGLFLDLEDIVYVPSIRRNLISISKLSRMGYFFNFNKDGFNLLHNYVVVGNGSLVDGLYKLNCDSPVVLNVGSKRSMLDERSSMLWHRRLGHISVQRMERLVRNKILRPLDFHDLHDCVDCMKGKMTKTRRMKAARSNGLLELIHTDISGPFPIPSVGDQRYFITFIDDFSRYGYLYLISKKSNSLDAFMIYKAEVENFHSRRIKTVRSDRGGEYYGRHGDSTQLLGPFAKYL
ncbi:uncharacterized protein LOC122643378 [Telopea speciosissima]|uniref:uncharacterized protein LOC122643378 n=1 Tax=Telopea speciosissima TaxID=54955 RepID=UPI001CC53517|nr:uncharacterized protein LOC122643378 [Telopea speciosissima]